VPVLIRLLVIPIAVLSTIIPDLEYGVD